MLSAMRVLRSLVLWLVCGTAATVAVSWFCALRCSDGTRWTFDEMALYGWEQRRTWTRGPADWDKTWGRAVPAHWPKPSYHYEFGNAGLDVDATLTYYAGCKTGWGQGIGILRAGWPLRAMRWAVVQDDVAPRGVLDGTWPSGTPQPLPAGFGPASRISGGIPLPGELERYKGGWVRLPVRPVAAGFAADTALFGAALWTAVAGPGTLRRAIRRRGGRCLACGYDLAGLPSCPECGRAGTAPPK